MNKKTLLIATLSITLVACAGVNTTNTSVCGENLNGPKDAKLTYRTKNKYEVSMDLKYDVKNNSEFRIQLDPKQNSDDAEIEIIGKSGELPDKSPTDFSWLNKKGKAADFPNKTMILCVPPNLPDKTMFKFDVEVGGIGSIDPRLEVIN